MNVKHYKNCQNTHKYLNKYEDDEFIIDRKIRRNYRRYKKNINNSTDSDSFEEENEEQKSFVKNSSVKKVIEKFNRLGCHISKPQICVLKPPEQIKISTHDIDTEKLEEVSVHDEQEKMERKRANKKDRPKNSKKNCEKRHIKYSAARKLRCSENIDNKPLKIENNDFYNIFKVPDEYIRFIDDVRRRNIIKYTPKNTLDNLQLNKNELKHFKSTKTQTSPYSSNTNILINVYNAPDPRIYNNLKPCSELLQLRVSQDDQLRLSITEEPHNNQNNMFIEVKKKRSVKNCVQEFEEFMKNKDISSDKKMNTNVTKKITKYKSNHLTEEVSAILLSPRAKSVPF